MRGGEGDPHLRTPMVEKGEEGLTMRVEEGAINCQQDNHHPSRFQNSRENIIPMSTLNGSKILTKSSTFVTLVIKSK